METRIESEHGGELVSLAQQMLLDPSDFLDFSSSINPLGPPGWVKGVLSEASSSVTAYPDSTSRGVRSAIARHWNAQTDALLVGNGSTELIFLAARAFHPRRTAIIGPTFSEYERAARLVGSEIHHIPLDISDGFGWNPTDEDRDAIAGSDVCYVCNPNNPSGTILKREVLLGMMRCCSKTLFVVDEAFVDFVPEHDFVSLLKDYQKYNNLVVLRSFTKFYAIAGLRLGYAMADPALICAMQAMKEPWSVNSLAQAVGERLLDDKAFAEKTRAWLPPQRDWLMGELLQFPNLECIPSKVNYLLWKIRGCDMDSHRLFKRLLEDRIVIRDASNFQGLDSSYLRIAIKAHPENIRLLESLKNILLKELFLA